MIVVGVLASAVATYDPIQQNIPESLQGPSWSHLLGTDALGRDVFSRLVFGTRSALAGVALALLVTSVIGIPWGLASGYLGGFGDEVLMRVADGLHSFPGVVLAIAITGALGPGFLNAMISVGVVFAPVIARLLRTSVLTIRRADYVLVSRSLGSGALRTAVTHVFPNAMAPMLVQLCAMGSIALLVQASLGFLGIGVEPPNSNWGADLASAYRDFTNAPLLTIAPGLVITVGALIISKLGDRVRESLGTE
jgi:peptide/nickel transport system permease protein